MQAIYLVKNGAPKSAFEFRDIQKPEIKDDEVGVNVEASGINFADGSLNIAGTDRGRS